MSNGSDTTYTISIEGKVITLTPSTGTAQTITLPDDLDTGFGAVGADGDKELKFVAQELVPSGTRNFSVTLASTGSSSQRRYSFVAGGSTGSIDATTDPGGIVRSVSYIASSATDFAQDERRKFRFQFRESARKNRSLSGAKLVVNGTEHDVEDWGISSDRRYREVRTTERVTTYAYSSGSAVTFNLKFGDGTYLGHASVTKTTRTLLKEDVKGALGITDVRENVTSVLQDVTDATATTSGEAAVVVSVPFDFHTVYDDAGMSPVYDAAAKRMSFEGLSDSERTSVVVRSNVRLRHNGGECSVELSLREFRGAAESNRWVLARKNLDEHGTLFAFDLAGESAEAEMSGGRYYRFDVDVKRSGDENATAGVHGTSAHVINFASFERVEEDRAWSPTERLAWPPNQKTSVRLAYGDRESGLKTTGYFFGDDEAESEVSFSREWKGVIGASAARVKFDVTYSGKSGSFRSPYDFRIAGSWVLSDGTATDWEEKLTVSVADASGSETLTLTPPTTAAGMYLRYVRETNTFTGSSDEITFAAGDIEISYVSGGSAAVPDATTDVKGKVELATTGEATTGSDAAKAVTPAGLKAATDALSIPSAPVDASESARGIAEIATEGEADAGTDSGRIMTPALVARLIGAGKKGGTSLPAGPVAPNYFVLTARDGTNEPGLYACSENGTWTRAMSMVSSDKTLSGDGAGTNLGLSEAEKKRMDTSYDFLRGTLLKASLTSGNNSDSSARGYADVAEGSTDGRNNVTFGSMDDATFTVGDDEYKILRLEQATGGDRGVLVKFGLSSSGALTPPALPETLDLRIGAATLRQRDAAVSAPKDKTVNSDGSVKDSAYIERKFASAPSGLIPAPASGAGGKVEIEILGEEADADKVVPDATEAKKGKMEIADQDEVNALSDATKAVTPGRLPEATATQKGLVELADEAGADTGTDDKSAMTPALVKRRIDAFDTSGAAKIKDFGVPVTRTKKTSIAVADSDTFLIRAAAGQTSRTVLYIEEGSEENYLDSVKAESRVFYGSKVYTIKTAERGAAVGGKSWAKFTMSEALSDVADDTSVTFYFTSRPLASSAELAKTTLSTQVNIADPGTVTTWTAWTDVLSWTAPSSGVFSFIGVFTSAMVNVPTGDRTWIELRVARTRGTATAEVLVVDKGRRVWLGSVPAAATLEWDFNFSALLDARANDVYKVQARFLSTQTSATRRLQFKTADNNFIWTLKQVAGEKGDKGDKGDTGSDTTYRLSISGNVLTLTPSAGTAQTITLPENVGVTYLAANADLNSLTDSGVYIRLSNPWSGNNNPFGTGGFVLYVSSEEGTAGQSNGHVRQTIRSFRQNQVYFVRETPDGDGTSTAVPSVITTGWLERDNYASYPEADVSNTIRVEAQQDVPSAVERDDLRASYGTSGTGGNAHYADSHPVRPLRESHWYPANYGVPADRNKVLQIYGTFGLHGKTISKLLIGGAGSVSEYDVTTTVSSAEGTTQIETTAGIPDLVSGGNTEIYYNLKFTDGSYLYSRVRAGSKTPVTLGREKMREWLGVSSVFEDETGTNGVEWRYSKSLSVASSPARLQLEIHTSSDSDAPLPAEWFTNNMKGYVSYVELSAAGRQVVHFSTSATGSNRHDRSQTIKTSVLSNLYLGVRNDTTGDVISIGPVKKDGSDRYIWTADAGKVAGFLSGAASGANDWTFVLFDASKRDRDNPLGESVTRSERDKLLEVEKEAQRNVKSDWNAASGDAQILNKPVIPEKATNDNVRLGTDDARFITSADLKRQIDATIAKLDKRYALVSASISRTSPASLAENNLNGAKITVRLANSMYDNTIRTSDFSLVGAPAGTTIRSVSRTNDTTAMLTLSFRGDFDSNAAMKVTVNASGHAGYGNLTTGTITIRAIVERIPSKPTGLTATAASATRINLSWTVASSGTTITSYQFRRRTGTGTWGSWKSIPGSSGSSYSHSVTSLSPSTSYGFQVRGLAGATPSASTSEVRASTNALPAAPTGLRTTHVSSTSATISWDESNAAGTYQYRVESYPVSSSPGFYPSAPYLGWKSVLQTRATFSLRNDRGYVVYLRVIDMDGNVGAYTSLRFRAPAS